MNRYIYILIIAVDYFAITVLTACYLCVSQIYFKQNCW